MPSTRESEEEEAKIFFGTPPGETSLADANGRLPPSAHAWAQQRHKSERSMFCSVSEELCLKSKGMRWKHEGAYRRGN